MVATRVLVVEDDRNYRRLVRVLDSAGYAVDLARNVAEAEHQLTKRDYGLVMDRYAFRNFAALETAARHEIWMKPMRPVELFAAIRITAAVGP